MGPSRFVPVRAGRARGPSGTAELGPAFAGAARGDCGRAHRCEADARDQPLHLLAPRERDRRPRAAVLRRRVLPVRTRIPRGAGRARQPARPGAAAGRPARRAVPRELRALLRPVHPVLSDGPGDVPAGRRQLRREARGRPRSEIRGVRDAAHLAPHRAGPQLRESRRQARARCAHGRPARHWQDDARQGDRVGAAHPDHRQLGRRLQRHVHRHGHGRRLHVRPRREEAGPALGRLHRVHRRVRRPGPEPRRHGWRRHGRHGRHVRRLPDGPEHAAGPDGRHGQRRLPEEGVPPVREPHARRPVRPAGDPVQRDADRAADPAAQAAALQPVLRRRHQPAVGPRRGRDAPGPVRPPDHLPDADARGPQGHRGPLLHQEGARPGAGPALAPRGVRPDHRGLLTGDDRAGHLDGPDVRVRGRPRVLHLARPARRHGQHRGRPRPARRTHGARADRDRPARAGARGRGPVLPARVRARPALDPDARPHRRPPPRRRRAGGVLQVPDPDGGGHPACAGRHRRRAGLLR